ncbi:germacrene A synthase [Tanacetum coccineum]
MQLNTSTRSQDVNSEVGLFHRISKLILFNMYTELEELLSKEGRAYLVTASRKEFVELATAYFQEAEWRHSGHLPSFQEYMKNGLVTSTYNCFARSAVVGMGTIVTEEVFAWYESHPKILQASGLIGRLHNDVFTFKVFNFYRHFIYNNVPNLVFPAIDELKKMVEDAWKEINDHCLKPTDAPVEILTTILNLARIVDVIYTFNDGYTFPDTILKEYITLVLVSPNQQHRTDGKSGGAPSDSKTKDTPTSDVKS